MNHHQSQVLTVGMVGLTRYTGPLGRFLEQQREEKAAAILRSMRTNITGMLDAELFSSEECQRCTANVEQCHCVAQLQRWFRNMYRVRTERQLAQAVVQRTQRGRTADYAAGLTHQTEAAEFMEETGLSYLDILTL
ncbi:hypothetical protein [Hymenobacter sp. GOD-10R]|uniref:hypothetical protein n=1 Tax=Hymenobacter sp. GOD-10R TaxID=3093922 RepID=UPI002D77AFD8|nr:hypothetical protein [Hymenobacter sp. GOD-10R]WRQ29153.1 hypothetical protein SD425_02605 [Hymenobacter sp. GOD-10R]